MAYRDLREFLNKLEDERELVRVKQEVDWNLEAGAVIRRASETESPAPLFEKIKGYPKGFRLAGAIVATHRRLAISLGLPSNASFPDMMDAFDRGITHPIKPRIVGTGPCKENIIKGDDVNLYIFPAPMLHDGDGGRYISTWHFVATKDPDTGWQNCGMYRQMVHNRNHLGGLTMPSQHMGAVLRKNEQRGKPTEFVTAIGTEPVTACVAASAVPYGVDELDVAGGIRGEPLEVVKCETVDLLVPATTEIVIEGYVVPHMRVDEGPFGEFTGYRASPRAPRWVYRVTCITYRNDPILTSSCMGVPPSETSSISALCKSWAVRNTLRAEGLPITDVYVCGEAACLLCIVSTKTPYPGIAHRIASVVWATQGGSVSPKVMVVNDDIDIHNMNEVIHAFATKCHPVRGTHIVEHAAGFQLCPYQNLEERTWGKGSNALYDCTWPIDWPPEIAVPPKASFKDIYPEDIQQRVLSNWTNYGFRNK